MEYTLHAKKRDTNLKPKQLRKTGWVPGCVYGKGLESFNIQIPYQKLQECVKSHAHTLNLKVEGHGEYFVGIDELQKGSLGTHFEHISFHNLNRDEKTHLTVEFSFTGKAKGQKEGGIVNHLMHEITIKGYPQDLPDCITVDLSELNVGDLVYVKDLVANNKYEFHVDDMEKAIVKCQYAKVEAATTETEATVESSEAKIVEETTAEEKKAA